MGLVPHTKLLSILVLLNLADAVTLYFFVLWLGKHKITLLPFITVSFANFAGV